MFEGPGTVLAADSKKRGGRRFTGRPYHLNISFAQMVWKNTSYCSSHLLMLIFYLENQDTLIESESGRNEDEEVKDIKASLNQLSLAGPTSSGLCKRLKREGIGNSLLYEDGGGLLNLNMKL